MMVSHAWQLSFNFCYQQCSARVTVRIKLHIVAHQAITFYNPPINFRAISLATLRHVLDSYHAITPV